MKVRQEGEQSFRAWVESGELRRAAQWLVERYADEVIGLCVAMVRDRALAEDLAQDAFGRAFTGLGTFRGEASSRTWLLRIVKNRCIDHLRQRQRDPWAGAAGEAEDPDAQPDEGPLPSDLVDRRDEVQTALSTLSEGERALIVLRFRNGLDTKELAMAFGLREGAVRMRISRALARLREALEEREEVALFAAQAIELEELQPASRSRRARAAGAPPARRVPTSMALGGAPPPGAAPPPSAPARPSAPAPASAKRRESPEVIAYGAPPRRSQGLLGRVLGRVFGMPTPPDPPVEHPLTAYFAATREALSEELLQRLRKAAQQIA